MTDHGPGRPDVSRDELRKLFLFEALDDDQLDWLAEHGWVAELPAASVVLAEGDPAEVLLMLLSGTLTMSRKVGQDDVETVRTDQVGCLRRRDAVVHHDWRAAALHRDRASGQRRAAVRDARRRLRRAPYATGSRWRSTCSRACSSACATRSRSSGSVSSCSRSGALSAGLTHELNNPAAAAVRATAALRVRVAGMRHKLAMLAHGEIDKRVLTQLVDVQEEAVQAVRDAPEADRRSRSPSARTRSAPG